jgi:deoxyribose-phosphate aldolase
MIISIISENKYPRVLKMELNAQKLAEMVDHSLLHPATTKDELLRFCDTVNKYNFATAYVLPSNIPFASSNINNGFTKIGTGIGFPFGTQTTKVKLIECEDAVENGAGELDVVINIGMLKSGNYRYMYNELKEISNFASPYSIKAILEVSYLTDEEIVEGSKISCDAGMAFIKTATGFGSRPTSLKDIQLIMSAISGDVGVKAAGGVRTLDELLDMYSIGVRRFGVSAGDKIIDEFITRSNKSHTAVVQKR